uniref:Transposase n=1 Tax=Bursaphelenchus xylophilus TaxID=6326 RepID=A0A1I7SN02_BURXY
MWRDARNYFFHLLQVQLSLFRMARRYVAEALGKDLDDLKVRHLEQAKNWLLNHLNQKGIRFNRAVKEPKYEGTHRIYDYDAENLIKYEESEEFARELRRLKSERTRQAILRWDEVMWRDARNYFFHLLQVQLSLFRMARRYVAEALGKDLDDLKVRHLEQAKNWLLNHLNQKGIRFNRAVKEPKYEGTHRIYDYDAENLIKYEESEEFARELRRLKSERTRQAIL